MANLSQIEKHLKSFGIPYKIIDLGGDPSAHSTHSTSSGQAGSGQAIFRVEDVVKAGVNPDEIVKTLVVRTKSRPPYSSSEVERFSTSSNSKPASSKNVFFVALAVRGRDRVDFKKVRRMFGPKVELAKWEEVQRVVGVPVGAVCPIEIGVPVYFDKKVMELKNVNLGSGDLTRGLEMKLADSLKAVRKYEVEDLT